MSLKSTERIVTALRLARRKQGVTVTQLSDATGVPRQAAHVALQALVNLQELEVDDPGAYRHVYRTKARN